MHFNAKIISLLVGTLVNTAVADWAIAGFPARNDNDCAFSEVTFATSGSSTQNCARFPPATTGVEFNGNGQFNLKLCGFRDNFGLCSDCIEYEGTEPSGCTAFGGYQYYEIVKH